VATFLPLPAGLALGAAGWEQTPIVVRQWVVRLLAVIQQQAARITALDTRCPQRGRCFGRIPTFPIFVEAVTCSINGLQPDVSWIEGL
jgi:hypothetical protein